MLNRESRIKMPGIGSVHIMQLMSAGDFEGFLEALAAAGDINQRYPWNQNMTLLEHACRVDQDGQQVQELLRRGAKSDALHPSTGLRALHIAAESLNQAALRLLLLHSDANALSLNGDNVLHVLCSRPRGERTQACVAEVLRLCTDHSVSLDVNHRNRLGETPIYKAAEEQNEPVVVLLLQHGCSIDSDDVQLGKSLDEQRRTARHLLQPQEWPEFQHLLPPEEPFTRGLVFLLYFELEAEFVERLPAEVAANAAVVNAHDGKHTLLQVAVEMGLERAVEKLLKMRADPNLTQPSVLTASEYAAYRGFPGILRLLIAHNAVLARENELSTMHWLIKGVDIHQRTNNLSDPEISDNYKECFDMLLEHKELLNARDNNDRTPLHLAAIHQMRDPYILDKLVDNGVLLGLQDKNGNTPLDSMTPAELHKFLSRRIEPSKPLELPKKVTFDIRFLRYFDKNEVERYDCQTLVLLSKCKDRRNVLTHPLVACFLHIKWDAIKLFYYIFFSLYLLFAVLLVFRVSFDEYNSHKNSSLVDNDIVGSRDVKNSVIQSLNYCLWFLLAVISVLTLLYYWVSWDPLHSVKRCLLKGMIGISSGLILSEVFIEHWHLVIASFAILLTGTEFVLLIGDNPKLAAYVKMLKTVTWNYFKFFLWFSPLIIAFILCFAILFRDYKKESLYNLGFWFFRGFVMLTGEFDAYDLIKETTTPFLSHVVFVMFVFFLAIVLLNLLNALAVNDTVATNEDTELYVNISRIELLHHAEMVFTFLYKMCRKENDEYSACFCRKLVRFIDERAQALSLKIYVSKGKIIFKINHKNEWIIRSSSREFILKDTDIIKRAENISRIENVELHDLFQDLIQKWKNKTNDAT